MAVQPESMASQGTFRCNVSSNSLPLTRAVKLTCFQSPTALASSRPLIAQMRRPFERSTCRVQQRALGLRQRFRRGDARHEQLQ